MRNFSFLAAAACVNFAAVGMGCVEIRPEYAEDACFFVREPDNHDNKLLKFKVKIDDSSVKKENGNLVFNIRLTNVEVVGKNSFNLSDAAIENWGSRDLRINLNSSGEWESDPIKIIVPEDVLKNTHFQYAAAGQFKLRIRNEDKTLDALHFGITPALSISIPEGERRINFGRITYDNGLVRSLKKHTFHLNYQCITQANLSVASDYNFQLKERRSDNFLPVRISLLINGEKQRITPDLHDFLIPSDRNNFLNQIEGKCYIKYATDLCPMAGIYTASILFTIRAAQ